MKLQNEPLLKIRRRIARSRIRVVKWETEAGEIEASWTGGRDYRTFCQGMAQAAREKTNDLEAKLKQLQGAKAEINHAARP